jgi:hypothetical protein
VLDDTRRGAEPKPFLTRCWSEASTEGGKHLQAIFVRTAAITGIYLSKTSRSGFAARQARRSARYSKESVGTELATGGE